MLLRSTQSMRMVKRFPSWKGLGPSGPWEGCGFGNGPTPVTPSPRRGLARRLQRVAAVQYHNEHEVCQSMSDHDWHQVMRQLKKTA